MTFTKVALYIRVSTEEQVINGESLEMQEKALLNYAKENKYKVIDIYRDEGYSARKPYYKRKEFLRLLDDITFGKIDLILFIKLDRWFRNIADYYKIQEILDKNNVVWKAIFENYDTTTANGRLNLNIKLSIAQDEADRTSERIKNVFDMKVQKGEVLSGKHIFGYDIKSKKMVINKYEANIVKDLFNYYELTKSINKTHTYLREKYDINVCYKTVCNMLKNPIYTGYYISQRGIKNENFCEMIISKEQFNRVQKLINQNIKAAPTGRIYLFTHMLICNECNHILASCFSNNTNYYRCNYYETRKLCTHNKYLSEKKLENYLLQNLQIFISEKYTNYENNQIIINKNVNQTHLEEIKLRKKLARLKNLYIEELINIEQYKKDYLILSNRLNEIINFKLQIKTDFNNSFKNNIIDKYFNYDQEKKRLFWQNLIKNLYINNNLEIVKIIWK